ncbi:MAG: ATP-binding cassette domain-containing protein [Chitinivibrionales bacterium]|nr:ATP-binding cassette domain-containing protein [Chitinivibrionales bacterium]MBD3397196.1 ATP-binding cassette domain-containing protein [Chitinivibrionales bacterium]
MQTFPLDSREITIGRDASNDIVLGGVGVSRVHARVICAPPAPSIADCGSTFGIRVDQRPVARADLVNGSRVTIGVTDFRVRLAGGNLHFERMGDRPAESGAGRSAVGGRSMRIGRDDGNDIALSHPLVSRFHCTVNGTQSGSCAIVDHGSTNGTFINGRAVHRAALADGDIVQVGPYRFIFDAGELVQADDYSRVRLEAFNVSVRRGRERVLDNVSLSIPPGEFVAILGPSGAGKTTLAEALTGRIRADEGEVYYNGFPLQRFLAAFSASIGYVSQHNLLRPELTVWETFWEQTVLRLPRDSLDAERIGRIDTVLALLEIGHLRHRRISRLSGGEAKRVHVGIELLSSPTVLFLDEPLAGLDPGLVQKFMELFRGLCDRGHTLLLTTHTLEQIELCGRLFLVSRGRVVFAGTPDQARETLGVGSLGEMYEKVRTESTGAPRQEGSAENDEPHHTRAAGMLAERAPAYRPRSARALRQLVMLARRYARVLLRDYRNMILILSQAPLIALLLGLVFKAGSGFLPISFYFCITISAIWMGGVNSIRELAREWHLFEREYRVGLSAGAYVCAKIAVLVVLSLIQAGLFALFLRGVFDAFSLNADMLFLIAMGCVSGSLLGLLVSALSGNVNRAISWLPIVFIPQIFLSGILIPFDRMPAAGKLLSHLTLSRPVFSMFKKVFLLEQDLWGLGEWRALLLLCTGLIILTYTRVRWHYLFSRGEH